MNGSSDYIDAPKAAAPKHPRLLKGTDIVRSGDFVQGKDGYVPWEGPAGFQAQVFVMPIYRAGARAKRS